MNPLNIFYTRAAGDHFFTCWLQGAINPGYLRPQERKMKATGQQFIIQPNTHAPYPIERHKGRLYLT